MRSLYLFIATALALLSFAAHILYLQQPFYMDEFPILGNHFAFASKITIIPIHAKYPTFYSYLSMPGTVAAVFYEYFFGFSESLTQASERLKYLNVERLVFPARVISLLFLVMSSICIFYMCKPFGKYVSTITALYLLATPGLLVYGSYALPEMLLLLLTSICFLFLLRALSTSEFHLAKRSFVTASIFAGLAISSKYNAVSVLPAVALTGFFLSYRSGKFNFVTFFKLGIASLTAVTISFLFGSPGWILSFQFFFNELAFEARHAQIGHLGSSGIPYAGQLELLVRSFPLLVLLAISGIIISVLRGISRQEIIAIIFVIFGLIISSQSQKQSIQYLYTLLPSLLFFFAVFLQESYNFLPKAAPILALTLMSALVSVSVYNSVVFLKPNTTILTTMWLSSNVKADQSIALDWAYVPKMRNADELNSINEQLTDLTIITELRMSQPTLLIEQHKQDPEYLSAAPADYIVTSELAYGRFFNFKYFTERPPLLGSKLANEFEKKRMFYEALFDPSIWKLVFETDTGNGPRTLVFAREHDS